MVNCLSTLFTLKLLLIINLVTLQSQEVAKIGIQIEHEDLDIYGFRILRWAGTYMDEIHTIQTRGAVAVETFTINSKEYIAIAQSEDSSGNLEVFVTLRLNGVLTACFIK